jgi:hypothetical protein
MELVMPSQEVHELRLEVQELRQFCIAVLMATPEGQYGHYAMSQAMQDKWWEKLTNYPKVEE